MGATEKHISLAGLNFGAPAAERDIDQGLADYFVESEAFRRVSEGKKTIVLGNRGTGKSAIFKVLAQRARGQASLVIELAPEDYSYEMLSQALAAESQGSWAKLGAYAAAWKYLIYVMVMKELHNRMSKLKTKEANQIFRYLRDNHAGVDKSPLGGLISYLKRMEGIKLGKYEAGVKTRELERLYRLEEITVMLPALAALCDRQHVVVFVDELDRGWDASEDARAFVAGLFQACVSINQLSPGLKVYMSLRQELYDNIPELYEDVQKYRDLLEVISWDEAHLLRLVANRIRYSVEGLSSASDEDAWGAVFAETLQYRGNKSFNYIVDRTLYRPRELISFCTEAADASSDKTDEAPIDYAVLSEAELAYSEARAKDIAAEYRFQYPGLLNVFEVFRGMPYTFARERLEEICLGLAVGDYQSGDATSWVLDEDPERLIGILWEVGFLRAQAVGGVKARRRSGSSYVGAYQVANLNLMNLTRFQVHPMFRSYLGSKEPKSDATQASES